MYLADWVSMELASQMMAEQFKQDIMHCDICIVPSCPKKHWCLKRKQTGPNLQRILGIFQSSFLSSSQVSNVGFPEFLLWISSVDLRKLT